MVQFAELNIGFCFLEGRAQLVGVDVTMSVVLATWVLPLYSFKNGYQATPRQASRNLLTGRPSGVLESRSLLC